MSETTEIGVTPTPAPPDHASTAANVADAASSGAAEAAGAARDGAKEVANEAVTQAKVVAGEARQQVSSLVDQTRGELSKQADERTKQAAGGLRVLADQVDALANGRPAESGPLAGLLGEAHGRVSGLAERLESGGPRQLVDDVSTFARRRPIVFLAAAVGAGFVVGRLARAGRAAAQDGDEAGASPQSAAFPSTLPALGSPPATNAVPLVGANAPAAAPAVTSQVP
jgi:hypothetical protein